MKFVALFFFVLLSCTVGSDLLSGPQDLLDIAHKHKNAGISDKFSIKHGENLTLYNVSATYTHSPTNSSYIMCTAYQQMYGMFLLPYCESKHHERSPIKLLEIGLGCKRADHNPLYSLLSRSEVEEGMFNGYKIWKSVLSAPDDELWYAEHDRKCLQMRRSGVFTRNSLEGLHILEGDQSKPDTLAEWVRISKGNFDIVIDDGSHKNLDIYTSFQHLWPHLKVTNV
jgi:hypothetical protein